MRVDGDSVSDICLLFEGRRLPGAEATRLAGLIGSGEELFANLVLRRRVFDRRPELLDRLRRIAADHRPATPQTGQDGLDLDRQRQTAAALAEAVGLLLAREREGMPAAGQLQEIWSAALDHRPATGFDLHLRVGPPGG